MAIAARLERSPESDRRLRPRHKLQLGTSIGGTGENASIHDISATGMLIETSVELSPLDALEVSLPENGATQALVMWSSGRFYGCEFTTPLSKAAISAVFLRSMPSKNPGFPLPEDESAAISARAESAAGDEDEQDEDADKWPRPARAAAIAGSALLLWATLIWAIVSVARIAHKILG